MPPNKRVPKRRPESDATTVEWLRQHVPIHWWYVSGGALFAALGAAFYIGTVAAVAAGSYQLRQVYEDKTKVANEVLQLEAQKAQLEARLIRLNVEAHVNSLTPAQVREELKEWTRGDPVSGSTTPAARTSSTSLKP